MEQEIRGAMQNLILHKKFNTNITTPPHIQEYIEKKVFELSIFRAVAQIDYYSGELFGSVDQEVPTRVAQQLDLLYRSLHSLDNNYPDTKYHEIVENIVNTSSAPLRKEIYEYMTKLQKQADKDQHKFPIRKNINELSKHFNKSRKTIKIQCLILVELGIFNVEYEIETLGRSFEQEIAYFYLKERQTTIDDGGDIN